MTPHRKTNELLEATGKLAVAPTTRRQLVKRGLLAAGGRAKADPVDNARPPADRAAFVRALLGR